MTLRWSNDCILLVVGIFFAVSNQHESRDNWVHKMRRLPWYRHEPRSNGVYELQGYRMDGSVSGIDRCLCATGSTVRAASLPRVLQ